MSGVGTEEGENWRMSCVLVSGLANGKWDVWQRDNRSKELGKLGV